MLSRLGYVLDSYEEAEMAGTTDDDEDKQSGSPETRRGVEDPASPDESGADDAP